MCSLVILLRASERRNNWLQYYKPLGDGDAGEAVESSILIIIVSHG